ncbi:hypothetical protein PtA15_2A472 [Puccinia triticina]|uniref:Uncharacterized protein n=1 Tax=Puccinia triticina TaxID=208348 RepID=A0ABY7CE23_9BASI|nr:uncharacterized protein PtA15_2A472 [Puccinia triticina]WAQ82157.1 hypothetical protein PtA15_2A472 [Puccinia triticina]WAR53015.1 hypothetical protein PtB15_2B443 [Puccinia triticina]
MSALRMLQENAHDRLASRQEPTQPNEDSRRIGPPPAQEKRKQIFPNFHKLDRPLDVYPQPPPEPQGSYSQFYSHPKQPPASQPSPVNTQRNPAELNTRLTVLKRGESYSLHETQPLYPSNLPHSHTQSQQGTDDRLTLKKPNNSRPSRGVSAPNPGIKLQSKPSSRSPELLTSTAQQP